MTLPFCLIRDQKHQDKCQSRTWCIYLLLLVAILLSGCQADNGWQKNTLARVQKVSTAGWDEFSARRLPKLLSTIQNNPEKARLAWLQLALLLQTHEATELSTDIFKHLDDTARGNDQNAPLYRYFLASGRKQSGQLDKALTLLDSRVNSLSDLDKVTYWLTQARWLMENGEYERARKALAKVEKISPHYPELLYRQATLALQSGHCQQAIDKLRLMLEYKPGLTQLYRPLASAYRLCQQPELAEEAQASQGEGKLSFENRFTKMAEQIGNPVKFLRGQVHQASAAGNLTQALKLNTQLLKLMPNDPSNHLNQGSILYRMGRYDLAVKAYRRGVKLQANHPELLTNLGNALWQLGRTDEAAAQYQQALRAQPRQQQARLNLAGLLQQQGQLAQSEFHYRKLLKIEPDNALARTGLIQNLLSQGKKETALTELETWWKNTPQNPSLITLAVKTALQADISPQEARADWLVSALSLENGAQPFRFGTSKDKPFLTDLLALWRYKTAQGKDPHIILREWQEHRQKIQRPATPEEKEQMQENLRQIDQGDTPEKALWVANNR